MRNRLMWREVQRIVAEEDRYLCEIVENYISIRRVVGSIFIIVLLFVSN